MSTQIAPNKKDIKKLVNKNVYPAKSLAATFSTGFFTVDHKWTVKYWNTEAENILNIKANDIVGKNLWRKFANTLPLNFYANYHNASLQDIPAHFKEYWEELGAWFDVATWYADHTLFVSFKNSHHAVQPEQLQLNSLNELYRFVTQVTNDCLWEWDLQAKEMFWIDGGHKRVFGYPMENVRISQSFWESRLHPDDKPGILTRLNKIINDGSCFVWEEEYRFKKNDGDYAFIHDRGYIIYGSRKIMRMIGAARDITEKVLLENKLVHERQRKLREITEAVLSAHESERATIGRELHDNLGQLLAVAKLYIQMAKTHPDSWEMYLGKSYDFIENVIQEIRKIAKTLVVPDTYISGLFDNIKSLINDLLQTHPIKIEFYLDNITEDGLDEKLQLTIYRVVQEQVNNILKHAKATRAVIRLSRQEDQVVLLISDNGQGVDSSKEKTGVGIINIRSRAELYHGKVTITSEPGNGYELKIIFSLKPPYNDMN